jgi:hypothetical protein
LIEEPAVGFSSSSLRSLLSRSYSSIISASSIYCFTSLKSVFGDLFLCSWLLADSLGDTGDLVPRSSLSFADSTRDFLGDPEPSVSLLSTFILFSLLPLDGFDKDLE